MKLLKVAVAHINISNDIRENGIRVREQMREAANAGCRLIQFPEGVMSGYCKQQIRTWADIGWGLLRVEFLATAKLAQDLGIWVVVGIAHRLTGNNLPHNSLYVISDRGTLVNRYDKRFISHGEMQGWYTPGKDPVIFEVDGIKVGLALCLEVQFPEIFDEYRRRHVDCVLLSAYAGEASQYDLLVRAHAEINNIWIGFSTPVNKIENDNPLPSSLIGPDGTVLSITGLDGEGLALGIVAPGDPTWDIAINKAKPWRELARKGEIYRKQFVQDVRSDDKTLF